MTRAPTYPHLHAMGYSAMMLIACIVSFPLIASGAAVAHLVAKWLRLTPSGVPGFLTYMLFLSMGYGLLFLCAAADMLILSPAKLQQDYVGKIYGTPWKLRYFEQSGFQDPGSIWRYRVSAADATALRRRCKRNEKKVTYVGCVIFADSDERWYAEVTLEGNELLIRDGLW